MEMANVDDLIEEAFANPVFETDRLIVGRWGLELAKAAFQIYGDPKVTKFLNGIADASPKETRVRLEKLIHRNRRWPQAWGSWPVFLKSTTELVGNAMQKPLPDTNGNDTKQIEIGWHLGRRHWGNGYATEFGTALITRGFERFDEKTLWAVFDPRNKASQSVALRIGMQPCGQTNAYYLGQTIEVFRMDRPSES